MPPRELPRPGYGHRGLGRRAAGGLPTARGLAFALLTRPEVVDTRRRRLAWRRWIHVSLDVLAVPSTVRRPHKVSGW
ncbi:Protein of unknown function [Micromonospora lupini str. Lupac 08]|uniref:Uncharacterized protein n=1 Tax=Micromonospora lupini str. Lupac 08 TaxID=1150864 RepID=I0LDX8_9ACTN|nr:Protein of unknown function [Micromonospora lupini str. Lupac 08]